MATVTTDDRFQKDVLESPIPVLVDFWAPWCGPCQMMGPIMDILSKKVGNKAKIFKLNIDENPETAGRYNITSIPTVMIFRNGTTENKLVGVQPENAYEEALNF